MSTREERVKNAREGRITHRKNNMSHFGAAKNKVGIDPAVTIYTTTDVFIESPFAKQTDVAESMLQNMEKTRMERSMKKIQSDLLVTNNRYIPPGQRDGADKKIAYGAEITEKDFHTLRITNVSLETTENELGDLFSRFGQLTRVKLMTDYRGNGSFAFISFSSKSDALEAKNQLQGYGLNHSILKIDTAVQKKRNNW
uniref:RRM domain-containing protein n=1 Tax=viral metagenome TaxID=1070528 RepID=A0A6C0EMJ5_9ZZZZ